MSGPEWTAQPADAPDAGRLLIDPADPGGPLPPGHPGVRVGSNPFGAERSRPVHPGASEQADAEAQANFDADEEAAGPGKLATLVGSLRAAMIGLITNLRNRRGSAATDADPTADGDATAAIDFALNPDPAAVPSEDLNSPPPARARSWNPAHWAWETRVGMAAVCSFLLLIGVLVVKKGWLGDLKTPTLALNKATPGAKEAETPAEPEQKAGTGSTKNSPPSSTPVKPGPTGPLPLFAQNPSSGLPPGPESGATGNDLKLRTGKPEPTSVSPPPADQNTGQPPEFTPPGVTGESGAMPPVLPDVTATQGPNLPGDPPSAPPPDGPPTTPVVEEEPTPPAAPVVAATPTATATIPPPDPKATAQADPTDPPPAKPDPVVPPVAPVVADSSLPVATPVEPATPRPASSPSLESVPTAAAPDATPSSRGEGWVQIPSGGKRPGVMTSGDPGSSDGIGGNSDLRGGRTRVAEGPPIRDDPGTEAGPVGTVLHTVQPDENFWTISKQYYNSTRYYKALHKANAGLVPDIKQLYVGTVIRIPPPETLDRTLVTAPVPGAPVDGPAFSKASSTAKTAEADPGAGAETPPTRTTRPGLRTARTARAEATEAPRRPSYRIKANDTLRSIARDTLGESRRSSEIYDLNRATLSDPKAILAPGTLLTLPEDAIVGRRSR